MNPGQELMEKIISGGLFKASCPASPGSPCLVVWSSGAAEQLDAMLVNFAAELEMKRANVIGMKPHGPDHVVAQLKCGHFVRFHKANRINFLIPCPECPGGNV